MDKMFELDYETRSFKPTVQWMAERYDEANQKLFNGELGSCKFSLFTTGKGSRGKTNGWFRMTGGDLRYNNYNRRMYKIVNGIKIEINRDNFAEIAKPEISLNGNKSGSEWAFMVTLVHEMCHYYDYSSGILPTQAHGSRFMRIANAITMKSGGQIEVTKTTTLERSQHFVLDDKVKQINDRAAANKKARANALVIYKKAQTRLIITALEKLIYQIYDIESNRNDTVKIYRSNDPQLIDTLFNSGYNNMMRAYRYWDITDKQSILDAIDNSEGKEMYENAELASKFPTSNKPTQTLSANHTSSPSPKIIFSIKTSNGKPFEIQCNSMSVVRASLKERFPKLSDEAIEKLISNRANFKKLEESNMKDTEKLIYEFVGNKFKNIELEEDGVITPDMNLSEYSPLEMNQ